MKKLTAFLLIISLVLAGCGQPVLAESQTIITPSSTNLPPTETVTPTQVPTVTMTASKTPFPIAGNGLVLDSRTVTALEAATLAAETMPGQYSWAENRHCSSYISMYMKQLGFPVNWSPDGKSDSDPNPFPWSNVVNQVNWLRANYPESVRDATLVDFLNGQLWSQIKPGSIVYLTIGVGHNGYNTYYHVAVLIGYHTDGSPQFAEFAGTMKTGASVNRTLWELAGFYPILPTGGWDITPYKTGNGTPPPLMITWIDPLSISP
jgi:hypothetical protein